MSTFKNVNVAYVYVQNWKAAQKFYRETLEWPVAYSDDHIGWEEYGVDGATHIAINVWDRSEPLPLSGGTVVLSVDDAYKTTEMLRQRGVKCDDVVEIPGVVTYGTFYDPEGNRFQFASSNA
jgi:predicted enzyme related to lactoylglutathione lyase